MSTLPPAADDSDSGQLFELLSDLDLLEEVLEDLGDLGVETRAQLDNVAVLSPEVQSVIADMDSLGVASRTEAERRMAELEALIDQLQADDQ